MKIQQIRNATILIYLAGKKLLIDPWLEDKGQGMLAPSPRPEQNVPSPLTDLPLPVEQILADVDAVLVTHIHPDHFDANTAAMLRKSIPLFVQNAADQIMAESMGFASVSMLKEEGIEFEGISFFRTPGMHGVSPDRAAGEVCGIVITAPGEKRLYIAGDTVWYDGVKEALDLHRPDIIVVNACAAEIANMGRLIMDAEDVVSVCEAAPYAMVIASHMDAVNHAMLTRTQLKNYIDNQSLHDRVIIPEDGECMVF